MKQFITFALDIPENRGCERTPCTPGNYGSAVKTFNIYTFTAFLVRRLQVTNPLDSYSALLLKKCIGFPVLILAIICSVTMNSCFTLHFKMKKLVTNSSKKYEGVLLIFNHH